MESNRLDLFTRVLAGAFVISIVISGSLWISTRSYPLTPYLPGMGAFPFPLDFLVFAFLLGSLIFLIALPTSRTALWSALALLAVLFLQDSSRLWPSFYEFSLFLLILATYRETAKVPAGAVLALCQFVLAAAYVWSGALKITPEFFTGQFPWFIGPLIAILPGIKPLVPVLGVVAAVAEMLFGLALLSRRFRVFAFWEAVAMHALIFVLIGPLRGNWNDSAWIWSLVTLGFLWILFYKTPIFAWELLPKVDGFKYVTVICLVAVGFLPVFNFINAWPSALSFNVYTGNIATGEIVIDEKTKEHLPSALQTYVSPRADGSLLFDVWKWSADGFNANPVPAKSIYFSLLSKVCSYAPPGSTVRLVFQEKTGINIPRVQTTYTCSGKAR